MSDDPLRDQADAAIDVLQRATPPHVITDVVLYGSAAAGRVRPDSDLDLLAVTARRLADDEKRRIVAGLLPISARATRPPEWRPLELTIVALPEVRPWRYPPHMELQYGEWLREDFLAGNIELGGPENPDIAILLTDARISGRALIGRAPAELFDPVPAGDLERAMVEGIPGLLADLADDTRNVLLTLARIWTTLVTGEIRSKDEAADWVLARLPEQDRPLLERARDLYRSGGDGEWPEPAEVRRLADAMIAAITAARDA